MKKNISLIMIFIIAFIFRVEGQIAEITPKKFGYLSLSGYRIMPGNLREHDALSLKLDKEYGNYVMGIDTNASKIFLDNKDIIRMRKLYFSFGAGISEVVHLGAGYQIDSQYALSIKYAITWVSYGAGFHVPGGSGAGWGITVSYFTNFWLFNNITLEYLYYNNLPLRYDPYDNQLKKNYGNYYQFNIGKEYILKSKKLQFYWLIGVGVSCPQKQGTLVLPTIGIGFTKNN